jgi:hypothetical protein
MPKYELSTPEIGLVQSASLAWGEARLTEYLDNPLGESALLRRDRRRVSLPSKLRANVLVHASLRASDLVCTAMQVAYLIEEGFELGLVERAHASSMGRASFLPDTTGEGAGWSRPSGRPGSWLTATSAGRSPQSGRGGTMSHRIAIIVAVAVFAGVTSGAALADPANVNAHNCAGLTSTFVPEENLGKSVKDIATSGPTAIPGSLDFANCGGNGFPP